MSIYTPILKGRQGEFLAVGSLPLREWRFFMPYFDFPRLTELQLKTAQRIYDTSKIINSLFVNEIGFYFEFSDTADDVVDGSGLHPQVHLQRQLNTGFLLNSNAVPVIGIDRGPQFQIDTLHEALSVEGQVFGLRIPPEDIRAPYMLNGKIHGILKNLGVNRRDVHLFFDMRSVLDSLEGDIVARIARAARSVDDVDQFGRLLFVGTSYPASSKGIASYSIGKFPRRDWAIWIDLRTKMKLEGLEFDFGDYGVTHPDHIYLSEEELKYVNGKIRYTSVDEVAICRGEALASGKFKQFHRLSDILFQDRIYSGPAFSQADLNIDRCRRSIIGPGDLKYWIAQSTSRHVILTNQQVGRAG